mgnify:CR=1 FL=1
MTAGAGVRLGEDGLLHATGSIYYLQPNDGLLPREPRGLVIRRWVEFPRRGPLPAIPIDSVPQSTIELYPDGPPILAEESIPMSAGWFSPAKKLFFAGLGVVGAAFAVRAAKKR